MCALRHSFREIKLSAEAHSFGELKLPSSQTMLFRIVVANIAHPQCSPQRVEELWLTCVENCSGCEKKLGDNIAVDLQLVFFVNLSS